MRAAQLENPNTRVVIFGKPDHPEVIGLKGQVENPVIVQTLSDVEQLNLDQPISFFAQTTSDKQVYAQMMACLRQRIKETGLPNDFFTSYDSICGQVANRGPWLAGFSKTVDSLIFVGGKNSSNSKVLFEVCRQHNANAYFITRASELAELPLSLAGRVGISGATSTPSWLIEEVAERLREFV